MLLQSLRYASATIPKASEVANTYGTSLTAAATRVVELIDSPALVVLSEDNRVRWVAKSGKAKPYFTVQKGDCIDDEALAWNCLAIVQVEFRRYTLADNPQPAISKSQLFAITN